MPYQLLSELKEELTDRIYPSSWMTAFQFPFPKTFSNNLFMHDLLFPPGLKTAWWLFARFLWWFWHVKEECVFMWLSWNKIVRKGNFQNILVLGFGSPFWLLAKMRFIANHSTIVIHISKALIQDFSNPKKTLDTADIELLISLNNNHPISVFLQKFSWNFFENYYSIWSIDSQILWLLHTLVLLSPQQKDYKFRAFLISSHCCISGRDWHW